MTTDQLLDAFKEMTLLELSEFVSAFEETFDVTAAAPMAMAVAAPAGGGDAGAAAEQDESWRRCAVHGCGCRQVTADQTDAGLCQKSPPAGPRRSVVC